MCLSKPKVLMSRRFSLSDRSEVYLGDENAVTLTFNARNEGEGGAYEAELYVVMPSDADYIGIARNNEVRHTMSRQQCTRFNNLLNEDVLAVTEELVFISPQKQENTSGLVIHVVVRLRQSFTQLTCSYDAENQTLVCNLGNPMKSGTSVRTKNVLTCL